MIPHSLVLKTAIAMRVCQYQEVQEPSDVVGMEAELIAQMMRLSAKIQRTHAR